MVLQQVAARPARALWRLGSTKQPLPQQNPATQAAPPPHSVSARAPPARLALFRHVLIAGVPIWNLGYLNGSSTATTQHIQNIRILIWRTPGSCCLNSASWSYRLSRPSGSNCSGAWWGEGHGAWRVQHGMGNTARALIGGRVVPYLALLEKRIEVFGRPIPSAGHDRLPPVHDARASHRKLITTVPGRNVIEWWRWW